MNGVLWFIGGHGGTPTDLWGGFISCLGYLGILGSMIAVYRKHKCQEHKCWRFAKHHVAGTPYTVCRRHHPAIPDKPARGQVAAAHAQAQATPLPEPVVTRRKRT